MYLDGMRVGQQNGSLSKLYKDWWNEAKYFNFYQFYLPVLNILLRGMTTIENNFDLSTKTASLDSSAYASSGTYASNLGSTIANASQAGPSSGPATISLPRIYESHPLSSLPDEHSFLTFRPSLLSQTGFPGTLSQPVGSLRDRGHTCAIDPSI
jgi:hypothetical protein